MTALGSRMLEDMQLHGLAPATQESYVRSVARLARHYHKCPDLISEEELRRYFLDLTTVQKVSRPTATIALCAFKFLFEKTLQRSWTSLNIMRPPKRKTLPVVLSREEVGHILRTVTTPLYRACLTTIYSCGLRLREGTGLKVQDIDSARMSLRVLGKGSQPREIPLPEPTLSLLRDFWRTHRSPTWLFPAAPRHGS